MVESSYPFRHEEIPQNEAFIRKNTHVSICLSWYPCITENNKIKGHIDDITLRRNLQAVVATYDPPSNTLLWKQHNSEWFGFLSNIPPGMTLPREMLFKRP